MKYYKTSQPVPGKGDAWMYYECADDDTVRRYLTYIPMTAEIDKVPDPFIKKLQRPELLMAASQEEFLTYWPEEPGDLDPTPEEKSKAAVKERQETGKYFHQHMTIMEAMAVNPRVAEVFAAFHLGGCSSCGVGEVETIEQVCWGYGVDVDMLLEVLEGLMDGEEAAGSTEEPESTEEAVAK